VLRLGCRTRQPGRTFAGSKAMQNARYNPPQRIMVKMCWAVVVAAARVSDAGGARGHLGTAGGGAGEANCSAQWSGRGEADDSQ